MSVATNSNHNSFARYRVLWFEKLVINFALPSDFVYHSIRALVQRDKSQTPRERLLGLWRGKVAKYQKLLRVKDENGGVIPSDYRDLCWQTPCGRVRYLLACIRSTGATEEVESACP